ncbi:MAG: hypothetical protein K2N64_08085 [Anaeroplasmataceae bacterium]|nr:hypothetical protein [Anaeroplasmataceae bacterium]
MPNSLNKLFLDEDAKEIQELAKIGVQTIANSVEDYIKDDEIIKSFINDEQLINFAITRAKEKFILGTSNKIANSNYEVLADFLKYICSQTDQVIVEEKVSTVFDILYDE